MLSKKAVFRYDFQFSLRQMNLTTIIFRAHRCCHFQATRAEGNTRKEEGMKTVQDYRTAVHGQDQSSLACADVCFSKDILLSPHCATAGDIEEQKEGSPLPGKLSHFTST